MNISKPSSEIPTVKDILEEIKKPIAQHGFCGFWFQGIANTAYEDYRNNDKKSLLSKRILHRNTDIIASSPVVEQLHQQYLSRVASVDINFGEALYLHSPYCYILERRYIFILLTVIFWKIRMRLVLQRNYLIVME